MTTWVLLAGPPAVGKSTLARSLVQKLGGGAILSKDEVRAALFPGELTDFSPEQDNLVFDCVLGGAAYLAKHNRARWIFLDGRAFSRRQDIERAIQAAEEAGSGWNILLLAASAEIIEARLRFPDPHHPAANRNVALYHEVMARFEPIVRPYLEVDMSQDIEQAAQCALEYLMSPGEATGNKHRVGHANQRA